AHPGHRRPHRRLHRLPRRPHRAGAGRRGGADRLPRPTLTARTAKRLPSGPDSPPPVIELDVTDAAQLDALAGNLRDNGFDHLDGVVHAIGFAPQSALGGNFLETPWEDVATAMHASAYSLKSLTMACLPLMKDGGSVVGLDFDASKAWPV